MTKTKTRDDQDTAMLTEPVAQGFRPAPSTRTVRADPTLFPKLMPSDGMDLFTAQIRDDLTIADQKKIPTTGAWEPIFRVIAPMVVNWNAAVQNEDTGEWELLPPPAEAGWEVLEQVSSNVAAFLVMCLKYNRGGDLPKGSSSSSDTDAGKLETG